MSDRYGSDVLSRNPNARKRSTEQPAEKGLVVECATTGFVGAVISVEYGRMVLEDFDGYRKPFPIGPGYLVDGKPVILDMHHGMHPDITITSPTTATGALASSGSVLAISTSESLASALR